MTPAEVWAALAIAETGDQTAIRRAYSRALKAIDPETDPAAFRRLREARDRAMHAAATGETLTEPEADVAVLDAPPPATDTAPPLPPPIAADLDALHALHAMVLDPASTATPAEIEAQTRRILTDPAMVSLDHAAAVENFLADLITRGSPRSDPILDPAIAHFRWNAPEAELTRPPILKWILYRDADRYFEIALPGDSRRYAALLARLRGPIPARWPRWTAWRHGPAMEFLIAYLNTFHPTVFASMPQETLDWWSAELDKQRALGGPLGWWRERRRRAVWERGLSTGSATVKGLFATAVGASRFSWWIGIIALLQLARLCAPAGDGPNSSPIVVPTAQVAAPIGLGATLTDPATDLDRLLRREFGDTLDGARARSRNPKFYAELEEAWREAKAHPEDDMPSRFGVNAARVMDRTLDAALRSGDDQLVLDHARSYDSRLRWAARAGADVCVDTTKGAAGDVPGDFYTYRMKLVARAIKSGVGPRSPGRRSRKTFTIPPAIFDDAVRRSTLSKDAFRKASVDRGSASARRNASIALIDAALEHPDAGGLTLLRRMFGG